MEGIDSEAVYFDGFKTYTQAKLPMNFIISRFYREELHRKWRLNAYSNTQRSEMNFLNRFQQTFGPPGETAVFFGDWEQLDHRRGKEPSKGKGFRETFAKFGYQVFLVHEFRTSKMCYNCRSEDGTCVKSDIRRPYPDPRSAARNPGLFPVHGLLICVSSPSRFHLNPFLPHYSLALPFFFISSRNLVGSTGIET